MERVYSISPVYPSVLVGISNLHLCPLDTFLNFINIFADRIKLEISFESVPSR